MRRRTFLSATLASAVVFGTSACGLDSSSGGGSGSKTVTVYTSRPKTITDGIVKKFESEHPEITLNLLTLGAQEVADRVRAEAGKPQADVWWGGTSQQFDQGVGAGLLEPFKQDVVSRVPEKYRGKDNLWLAEQRLAEVIAYNNKMLTPDTAPKDWDDLVKADYKKKILIRDVAASGTMRSIFGAMILKYGSAADPSNGYAWLKKLDANTKDYTANPTDLYLRIQRQEAPLTVWNLQDIMNQQKAGVPFTPVVPTSGAPVLLDGVGKVKNCPNKDAADTFAAFLLSDSTQQYLAENNFQIPTVELAKQPDWLAKVGLKEMNVDWAMESSKEAEWINYWVQNIKNHG
ncbi:extracellular solute-binding protein [Psychromicrobium xiongbiense]|uniref:extracellular solute-binding protein n=1 Tax=Psychromicrobium xiongbiense TaxID=3051184 RepID=UPI0025570B54|nr:extracellular solute-binding protein [Psychromicrobium sp. YIM S02556]